MSSSSLQIVKDLASAVSTQARVANRFWFALMTIALFALLPRLNPVDAQSINLPLGLGAVGPASLYPVLFAVLVVLIVAFAAAHTQQVRAQKLAQDFIDRMNISDGDLHPRELFDMFREPSVIRVAPLAQSLRGRYQFFETAEGCPVWLRWASVAYYAVLKLASVAIYFLLPGWALWSLGLRLHEAQALSAPLLLPAIIASLVLVQVLVTDVVYSFRVLRHLSRRSPQG